jgi:hypothetical protein
MKTRAADLGARSAALVVAVVSAEADSVKL